jgi:hypothetical protein
MSDEYSEKYTKPDLRRVIKEELMASDKGGEPGEWSARKSQLLVQEYERRGGGYTDEERDEAARSLEAWTQQNWQTKEGRADAQSDGKTQRYLPEKVWAMLTPAQRREAEQSKLETSAEGEQFADWPDIVKKAMAAAGFTAGAGVDEPTKDELNRWAAQLKIRGRSKMSKEELQRAIRDAEASGNGEAATKEELYERAQELDIRGRSKMSKEELRRAIRQKA